LRLFSKLVTVCSKVETVFWKSVSIDLDFKSVMILCKFLNISGSNFILSLEYIVSNIGLKNFSRSIISLSETEIFISALIAFNFVSISSFISFNLVSISFNI